MYRFTTELWLHDGEAGWHFVTLPGDVADDVRARTAGQRGGFGSVRVRARVGATSWTTSVFPDARASSFVLPVKKPVRAAERLVAGDRVEVVLELVHVGP